MKQELIPHLFRTEFQKITAVLCSAFGIGQIQLAEDIASDTFLLAVETWSYKGVPGNPTAWLYTVAKNKARNYLKRDALFRGKISKEIRYSSGGHQAIEIDLSEENITDSQLQMLFAVCHPSISTEGQVALALRVLCGFGIDEIANAFLTGKETIRKRLTRAKEKLRQVHSGFPGIHKTGQRLETVLLTLYLLYNEGYYSESDDRVLREDLCLEAMRLTYLLIQNEITNQPEVNALLALMCFHSSRFAARKNEHGGLILYEDQDESLWSRELISKGAYHLHQGSQGNTLSKYHLEAAIAWWHTVKTESPQKWENILKLYDHLLEREYSPVAALNRTFALSKVKGLREAITEAEKLQLTGNHYYYTLLGELYKDSDRSIALGNFRKAYFLAKTPADRETLARNIAELQEHKNPAG